MAKKFGERRRREYLLDMLQNCRKLSNVGRAARNAEQINETKKAFTNSSNHLEQKTGKSFKAMKRDMLFNSTTQPWNNDYTFFYLLICLLFIWLHQVLAAACGTRFPDQRFSLCPLNWESRVFSHWTTREVCIRFSKSTFRSLHSINNISILNV